VALLTGMTLVAVFYVLIQVVAIGTLPGLASSQRPLADAAARFLGPGGAVMITVGIVISLAGNLNVVMLSASRILFAMAERGELPARLAAIHPRHRTPSLAVLATAAIMLGLTLSGTFLWLLTLSTLSRLVTYMATAGALPVLRRRWGAGSEPGCPRACGCRQPRSVWDYGCFRTAAARGTRYGDRGRRWHGHLLFVPEMGPGGVRVKPGAASVRIQPNLEFSKPFWRPGDRVG
jgi:hypothetical protein